MKAWRFYGFGDLRLDDVPEPVCQPGHVIAEPLCVQPSVTEAQLAFGIPTLAFETIKRRLETECAGPIVRARVLRAEWSKSARGHARSAGRSHRGTGQTAVRALPAVPLDGRAIFAARGRSSASTFRAAFPSAPSCPRSRWSRSTIGFPTARPRACSRSSDSVAAVETANRAIGDTVAIFGQGSMGLECLQIARNSAARG